MVLYGADRAKFIKENSIWGTYDRVPMYFIVSTQLGEILKQFNEQQISKVCISINALEALLLEQFADIGGYFRDLTRIKKVCHECPKYLACRLHEQKTEKLFPCNKKPVDYLLDDLPAPQRMVMALDKFRIIIRHMKRSKMLPQREIIKDIEPEKITWDDNENEQESA